MPDITLTGIQKQYGRSDVKAVENLDLVIGDGEFMCLLGPSGCGKTTTLRMIAGLEHPTAGSISVGDRMVDSVENAVFTPPEKRGMGLVFQSYALWPHLTIEKNVDFGLRLRKIDAGERKHRTESVMEALGIAEFRNRYPGELSGGQQQRVALARMLAVNPDVLLLDEPLSNLDARLRLEMRRELKRIHAEFGTTIVFVTHDQWEAMTLATTIAVMSRGLLQQVGTPDDIYDRPANRFVAEFVGSPPINIIDLADHTPMGARTLAYLREHRPGVVDAASVGIRPEALQIGGTPVERAFIGRPRVGGVLPTGGNWIIELDNGDKGMFAITTQAPKLGVGEEVMCWVAPQDVHVFAADGSRIANPYE